MSGTQPTIPERGVSPIASRHRFWNNPIYRRIGMVMGVGAASLVGVMGVVGMVYDKGIQKPPDKVGSNNISQVVGSPLASTAEADKPPAAVDNKPPAKRDGPPPVVAGVNFVHMPANSGETFFAVPAAPPPPPPQAVGGATVGGRGADKTTVAFKPSIIPGGKAGPAIDMSFVLRPQLIPCALDTAMDSQFAGAIMCHTTQDILSQAHILLLPAGTEITGTYKNDVHSGQNRLFAFAGTAITPEGIPVELDSDISDGLGMTGIPGDVDNHYLARYGAALFLNGIDIAASLGQAALSKSGSTTLNLNSGGTGTLTSQILQNQVDQPPTITVPPGTIVSIVVTHPISFRDALKVTTP